MSFINLYLKTCYSLSVISHLFAWLRMRLLTCSTSVLLRILPLTFLQSSILNLLVLLLVFCSLFGKHSFILLMRINCWRILVLFFLLLYVQRTITRPLVGRGLATSRGMMSIVRWRVSLTIARGSLRTSFDVWMLASIFWISGILCSLFSVNFISSLSCMRIFSWSWSNCKVMIHLHAWILKNWSV